MQGAVFLPNGSTIMFSEGISPSCAFISFTWELPVTIKTFLCLITGSILWIAFWISVLSPVRFNNCFGVLSLLRGQNLVPLPPAIITPYIVFNLFNVSPLNLFYANPGRQFFKKHKTSYEEGNKNDGKKFKIIFYEMFYLCTEQLDKPCHNEESSTPSEE